MSENGIQVRMLGGLCICLGDVRIDEKASRSDNVWLFLAYLIYNRGRMVPREELLGLLERGGADADRVRMLQHIRWSARKLIKPLSEAAGAELILGQGGAFGWNPDIPLTLDAAEFDALCAGAKAAGTEAEKAELLYRAVLLFRGDFLARLSGDFWAGELLSWYRGRCFEAAEEAVPLLEGLGRFEEAEAVCRTVLKLDPYQEGMHRALMGALVRQGDYAGADAVYQKLRSMLFSELGVMPEEATRAAYQEVARGLSDGTVSPAEIQEKLREDAAPTGALLCDFSTFRMFYQAEARSADRRGDAIHIGVLSVVGKGKKPLSGTVLRRAMNELGAQIQETLRIGDIAACCSASQYVLLLVQTSVEDSDMVCGRVARAFARAHPHSQAEIEVLSMPLEPLFLPKDS